MTLDQELKRALRRRDPPSGFAERTLARLNEPASGGGRAPGPAVASRSARRLVAAAAAVVLLAVAGERLSRPRPNDAGEQAAREVERALRLTREALATVREKVAVYSRDLPMEGDRKRGGEGER
jgi:hypothetical protein